MIAMLLGLHVRNPVGLDHLPSLRGIRQLCPTAIKERDQIASDFQITSLARSFRNNSLKPI
jgi:hypothetical protein